MGGNSSKSSSSTATTNRSTITTSYNSVRTSSYPKTTPVASSSGAGGWARLPTTAWTSTPLNPSSASGGRSSRVTSSDWDAYTRVQNALNNKAPTQPSATSQPVPTSSQPTTVSNNGATSQPVPTSPQPTTVFNNGATSQPAPTSSQPTTVSNNVVQGYYVTVTPVRSGSRSPPPTRKPSAPVHRASTQPAVRIRKYYSPVAKIATRHGSAIHVGDGGRFAESVVADGNSSRKKLSQAEEINMVIAVAVKLSKAAQASGASATIQVRSLSTLFDVTERQMMTLCAPYPDLVGNIGGSSMESPLWGQYLICYNYNCGTCRQPHLCKRIHVCCRWLFGRCSSASCTFEHTIATGRHNASRLAALGVQGWTDEQLKFLLLGLEHPISMVCKHYNSPSGCKDGENCGYFHICAKFIDKKCRKSSCGLNHRVHHCENRRKIEARNSVKRFDEAEQLKSRLHLKLSIIPKSATADALVPKERHLADRKETWVPAERTTTYAWTFLDNDGTWKLQGSSVAGLSFGLHVPLILEEAYKKRKLGELGLTMGRFTYTYDEATLEQKNSKTLVKRKLKREHVHLRNDLPPSWMPMIDVRNGGEQAVAFPLSQQDAEFLSIKELFNAAGGVRGSEVLEIYRIQNPRHKKIYDTQKAELARLYEGVGASVVEKHLFHGTDPRVVKSICEQNFDWRRSGEAVGTKYGRGSYFALKSSYSHRYGTPSRDGTRLLIVANVLVGLTCKGEPNMKYPPTWKGNIKYDTTVDSVSAPSIFVKYESHEYYPTYLVQYRASE